MKCIKRHIIFILLFSVAYNTIAQDIPQKGYRIEGDEVVFTFNKQDYNYLTHDELNDIIESSEVYIKTVAVAGEFNDWSKNKWRMEKVGNETFEFRKKIGDFSDQFHWEFKFVINNAYWAEPSKKDGNISKAKTKYGIPLPVYNLKMYTSLPSKNGNVTFKLKGYTNAKRVVLSGTFNRWDEKLFKMNKIKSGWELTLQLKPDVYQYKFIVDGQWIEDPNNPSKVKNEYNGYNSIIDVHTKKAFKLNGFSEAKTVILSGSFNNWSESELKMIKTEKGWEITTVLPGGKHHYKFIVDGKWITDPENPVKEYDNDGHINSVAMVR